LEYFVLNFQKFMLVFSRLTGLMFTASFYESDSIPNQARLGLTFFITAVIFPIVYSYIPDFPQNFIGYAMVAIGEAIIGATIGICITISFSVFQLAGQYFTVQMGFGASEVFDPMSQISIPLIGQYLYIIAILVFLALRGPLLIIQELYYSYQFVTFSNLLKIDLFNSPYTIFSFFIESFSIALRISFPIVATLLLVSISMGLLAKAAPQMNLLMVGFPVSIFISFVILLVTLPLFVEFVVNYFDEIFKSIFLMMKGVKNV